MTESTKHDRLLEPLRMALKLEQEGKKFFTDAAHAAESSLARKTFLFLAAEEDNHIARINEFYQSIKERGQKETLVLDKRAAGRRFAQFNDDLAKMQQKAAPALSDLEAYRAALKFESGAEELYKRQLTETSDPGAREFYSWLIHEEEIHSKVLESCLLFAEDPAKWFRERGK